MAAPFRLSDSPLLGRSPPVKGNDDLTLAADQICVTTDYLVGVTFSPALARK